MSELPQDSGRLLRLSIFGICLLVLCFSGPSAGAVDIHPDAKKLFIENGTWEGIKQDLIHARAAGMDTPRPRTPGLAASIATGERGSHIPCILVDFPDNQWETEPTNTSTGFIDTMLFSEGAYSTGSLREYYLENSYGLFGVTGQVVGPVELPETYEYYVGSNHGIGDIGPNARDLAHDAVVAADHLLDYSQFDMDGIGGVDGVMIIFAGPGFEEAFDEESVTIQSHQWSLRSPITLDGVSISEYTIQPEEHGSALGGGTNGIGVWCHELGHILGAFDLYDEDFSSQGVGNWSLMGSGNYLNYSHTPSHFDPWTKVEFGWVTVDNVQVNRLDQTIPNYAESPTVLRLWTPGITWWEYFLVCNRQPTGFDAELPGGGLMIMHIDESRSDNRDEYIPGVGLPIYHYMAAIVQADGDYDLERSEGGNSGDAGDLYTDRTSEFDDLTTPSSRGYTGFRTEVAVWNISPSGPTMTANIDVTFSRPLLRYVSHYFADAGGDGDGTPDPGETVDLVVTTENLWKTTTDVYLTVSCSDPQVVFNNSSSYFATFYSGSAPDNAGDPINFSVPAGIQPTIADFYLNYVSEGGAFTFAETLSVDLGPKQVLIVDDDANYLLTDYDHYYTDALTTLRIPHEVHDKNVAGSPTTLDLTAYPMVCWYTGYDRPGPLLVHNDVVALQGYLDAGGRLLLTGQDIAEKLTADVDSTFLFDYLGVRHTANTLMILSNGVPDDPVSDGHALPLGGAGGASNQHSPDVLELVDGIATPAYTYYGSSDIAGVRVEADDYRAVFLGFGLEAVANGLPGYTKREDVMAGVIFWMIGLSTGILEEDEFWEDETPENIVPSRYTLSQNYPNPFNGRTVIEYSVAPGQVGEISLEILNILGRKVTTLFEGTVSPGLHRAEWDGRDSRGENVASGVYFYRISDRDGITQSRRMVYLK